MNDKSNTKAKPAATEPQTTRELPRGKVSTPENSAALEAIWKEELATLSTQRFQSLDLALETIVDRVLARVAKHLPEPQVAEMKNFLMTLLTTDAKVKDALSPLVQKA